MGNFSIDNSKVELESDNKFFPEQFSSRKWKHRIKKWHENSFQSKFSSEIEKIALKNGEIIFFYAIFW